MQDFLLITLFELVAIVFIWSTMAWKKWGSAEWQKRNPHLRICYYTKKWLTPLVFMLTSGVALLFFADRAEDDIDLIFLNILVLFVSLFFGTLISQAIINHFVSGRSKSF
jgi:hypothetical protein